MSRPPALTDRAGVGSDTRSLVPEENTMPTTHLARRLSALATTASLALPISAHATADWQMAAVACVADSLQTMQLAVVNLAGGYIESGGRNPPLGYSCPVANPDDGVTTPSWTLLRLGFVDLNASGGGVTARLYAKSRSTGTVSLVTSIASLPSASYKVLVAKLPKPLDFKRYSYYVALVLDGIDQPVQAHVVMLTSS